MKKQIRKSAIKTLHKITEAHRWLEMTYRRTIIFFFQRLTRGWDDSATWSLDHSLAKEILPRLRRFQEIKAAHPSEMSSEEWSSIIQQMIDSFEFYASGQQWEFPSEKRLKEVERGMKLFARYYGNLWW